MIPWNGHPITEPGTYTGMPLDFYHGKPTGPEPCISSSGLRTIWTKSEAHYWCDSPYNPRREDQKDESDAVILGRAAHHLLLGEQEFSKRFVLRPERVDGAAWNGNRTACKEWLEMMKDSGLTVLTPTQREKILRIRDALANHPAVQSGMLDGDVETSTFWKDEETGIWLRSRPDVRPSDDDYTDLKVTHSVQTEDFVRSMRMFRYDMQGALVGWGHEVMTGRPITSFTLVCVESSAPYCVRVFTLDPKDQMRAAKCCRWALKRFKRAWDTGCWPGPHGYDDVETFRFPEWAADKMEAEISKARDEAIFHGQEAAE
ncbi:PD-(D/E)XK nuclease-like domain-containing protein [Rhodobium gokarnense]|uniref:Putative exodeoxyribonuclease 8 PDDEXK-like domain-containing protein n=1 Tax=Rhodobium gokarnense TaxID=364296 RepID=A0ABT3HH03_9HYPH|nr:PD-(D/E)XK nuclease-like domain-containing protein [Rhodobium gokarnense]MCW2309685.1 hypothetical protein [Rhodobium gokarnense]